MKVISKISLGLFVFFGFTFGSSYNASAEDSGSGKAFLFVFPERQKERKASRWTLADWLTTKKKIEAQNFWLAQHTNKLPMDFTYSTDSSAGNYWGHEIDIFFNWFGIEARYEYQPDFLPDFWNPPADYFDLQSKSGNISAQIRLFGANIQDTNLILKTSFEFDHFYNNTEISGLYQGLAFGPELQIYFANWLGVRGFWNYRFKRSHQVSTSPSLSGANFEYVAFLEMGAIRLEFGMAGERAEFKNAGGTLLLEVDNTTLISRLKLFF